MDSRNICSHLLTYLQQSWATPNLNLVLPYMERLLLPNITNWWAILGTWHAFSHHSVFTKFIYMVKWTKMILPLESRLSAHIRRRIGYNIWITLIKFRNTFFAQNRLINLITNLHSPKLNCDDRCYCSEDTSRTYSTEQLKTYIILYFT